MNWKMARSRPGLEVLLKRQDGIAKLLAGFDQAMSVP